MPFLTGALVSLAISWVRGVSPLELGTVRLRWLPLPLVIFFIQVFALIRLGSAASDFAMWVQIVTVGLLLVFLLANLRYRSFAPVLVGTALNLLVQTANGGYMPVRIADVERAGFPQVAAELRATGHFQKSETLDEHTRFPRLADIIYIPFFRAGRLISIGDICIAAGVFLFIQEALVPRRQKVIGPAPTVA